MASKITKDYLAGFIDGEGSFGIYKHKFKNRNLIYVCRITIANTNYNVLEEIQKEFGGHIYNKKNYLKWKQGYNLCWDAKEVDKLLKILDGRLVIKQEQLDVMVNMRKLVNISGIEDKKELLYNSLKNLNERGNKDYYTSL
jgi:hypothetical protein